MGHNVKKTLKKVILTLVGIIVALVVIGGAVWLIDGRSPQVIIMSHLITKNTMEDYEKVKGDKTDKSTVEIPSGVVFPREMRQYRVGGMQVFHMEAQDDSKPIVLYLHGGAYLNNFKKWHWKAMAEWAEATGCGIVAPNYPLLYCYTAKDAHPLMMRLYRQLVEQYSAKRIIIMGDSAGGGFTLALAQQVRDSNLLDLPCRLILISPWVDVLGGDDALQEKDKFLDAKVLRCVGADWAGDIDPHDPMISPLYGNMQSLPPTDIFTGACDIFYTDAVKTYNKMKSADVEARLHAAEKMGHDYPLWPCPEGRAAREEIAKIILQ